MAPLRAHTPVPLWVALAVAAVSAAATWAVSSYGKRIQKFMSGRRLRGRANSVDDGGYNEVRVKPPFPKEIVEQLASSTLCYLSTQIEGHPHLSLMNFTYVQEEEKIVMSTRRNTTKYEAMMRNPNLALLVHDFPTSQASRMAVTNCTEEKSRPYNMTHSITLYGRAQMEQGAEAEKFRDLHLERHGETQKAFIVGDEIAIVTIEVTHAKICNAKDEVKEWKAGL